MPKPKTTTGEKNLISKRLIALRKEHYLSQRDLSRELQLAGYDMDKNDIDIDRSEIDKNVITRIETNKRYVTDIEIRALAHIFGVTCDYLIEGEHAD